MKRDYRHKEVILAFFAGEEIQVRTGHPEGDQWRTVVDPIFDEGNDYRIKPAMKTIDLSKLINANILCMFRDNSCTWQVGFLIDIAPQDTYHTVHEQFTHCKPRIGYWTANTGHIKSPIPEGFTFSIRRRDGRILEHNKSANGHYWGNGPEFHGSDIIQFKITGICGGWEYPWSKTCTS
jgi:hypothetical protein